MSEQVAHCATVGFGASPRTYCDLRITEGMRVYRRADFDTYYGAATYDLALPPPCVDCLDRVVYLSTQGPSPMQSDHLDAIVRKYGAEHMRRYALDNVQEIAHVWKESPDEAPSTPGEIAEVIVRWIREWAEWLGPDMTPEEFHAEMVRARSVNFHPIARLTRRKDDDC